MENSYGIDIQKWYSPNEIVDNGLLFGKSKRYVLNVINEGKLKATNTSDTTRPQWKILGSNLIEFIRSTENENSNNSN